MKANCRNCKHFVPAHQLNDHLLKKLLIWVAKYRPNQRLLGYCSKFRRAVTYLEGYCSGYKPKREDEFLCKKLTEFMR